MRDGRGDAGPGSSSRSSPPSRPGRGRAWGWRRSTAIVKQAGGHDRGRQRGRAGDDVQDRTCRRGGRPGPAADGTGYMRRPTCGRGRRSCWSRTRTVVRTLARRVSKGRGTRCSRPPSGAEALACRRRHARADRPAGDRRGDAGDGRPGAGRAAARRGSRGCGCCSCPGTRTTRWSGTGCEAEAVALPPEAVHAGRAGPQGPGGPAEAGGGAGGVAGVSVARTAALTSSPP